MTVLKKASDEYCYFKDNEQFSYRYVDEFIDKMLQNELIPDMLIETLSEMTVDENNVNKFPLKSDRYVREPSQTRYMPVQMSYDGQGYGLKRVRSLLNSNFICSMLFKIGQ